MGAKSSNTNKGLNNRSDGRLLEYFRDTFLRGGGSGQPRVTAGGGAPSPAPQTVFATGGVINEYSTPPGTVYRAHIFTSSGTFQVVDPSITSVEYLVVAGGGAGGGTPQPTSGSYPLSSGGGGAGGLRTNLSGHPLAGSPFPVSPGSYTITIGAGGNFQSSGSPSAIGIITATGGGRGAYHPGIAATSGGSGGGGGAGHPLGASGNTPPTSPSQGNPGGNGNLPAPTVNPGFGGGGGGAGGAGGNGTPGAGGVGGIGTHVAIAGPPTFAGVGVSNPSLGQYQWFAGGGGGGHAFGSYPENGGVGGGGQGGIPGPVANPFDSMQGKATTGGGGGGGTRGPSSSYFISGGNGGSGVAVVRYAIPTATATAKATGGVINYYNGKTIHTFLSSDTFTVPAPLNPTPLSIEYVIVAGGGAGGGGHENPNLVGNGGGGAGGYATGITTVTAGSTLTVTVGSGGAGGYSASNGTPSWFGIVGVSTITVAGGGVGNGVPGGSGGGASITPTSVGPVGAGITTPTQGHPGGSSNSTAGGGGGGGGAGGAGWGVGGNGGSGIQIPATFQGPNLGIGFSGPYSGTQFFVAGGGGGAPGGKGGGAGGPYAGAGDGNPIRSSGASGSGSGGGAGTTPLPGGNGGSGIILIAYPT